MAVGRGCARWSGGLLWLAVAACEWAAWQAPLERGAGRGRAWDRRRGGRRPAARCAPSSRSRRREHACARARPRVRPAAVQLGRPALTPPASASPCRCYPPRRRRAAPQPRRSRPAAGDRRRRAVAAAGLPRRVLQPDDLWPGAVLHCCLLQADPEGLHQQERHAARGRQGQAPAAHAVQERRAQGLRLRQCQGAAADVR
jgi:hypothetical protein